MVRLGTTSNILMELRKICQHPYLSEPELDNSSLPEKEQHRRLIEASGKLKFLKQLLPRLKERGFRVLLFSQFKIALDMIEDFLYGEGYNYLRLDGDVAQVNRQKDMDKFNAPDSEYFIFLLTTRAGGVGINLATADAVIMFDPDFNPHQDLQAISRSHRFGQKKRVLVFRLMAENTIENRIINNGKRKMVLDHLVVQQMGKETEEGEVDNLILYGAEEIAKSNPDDTSADRVWTKELIDELIDGAEKEAAEQAKEQAARDAAEATDAAEAEAANAEGEGNEAENAKKGGFSFARVWETKSHGFKEPAQEEAEPEPFADDAVWAKFLSVAEQDNHEHEVTIIQGDRVRKVRKPVSYNDQLAGLDDEDSPKSKKKGKGKATDDDFVAATADSDSDTDLFFDAVPENLIDLSTEPGAAGPSMDPLAHTLNKAERKALKRREALAQELERRNAAAQQEAGHQEVVQRAVNAAYVAGMAPIPRPPQVSPRAIPASLTHEPSMSLLSNGPIFRPTNPGMLVALPPSALPPRTAARPTLHQGAIHGAKVASAREVLVQMKGVLTKSGNKELLRQWYDVASKGLPANERKRLYRPMAASLDAFIVSNGHPPYYTKPGNLEVVHYYIELGDAIVNLTDPPVAPPMIQRAAAPQQLQHQPQPPAPPFVPYDFVMRQGANIVAPPAPAPTAHAARPPPQLPTMGVFSDSRHFPAGTTIQERPHQPPPAPHPHKHPHPQLQIQPQPRPVRPITIRPSPSHVPQSVVPPVQPQPPVPMSTRVLPLPPHPAVQARTPELPHVAPQSEVISRVQSATVPRPASATPIWVPSTSATPAPVNAPPTSEQATQAIVSMPIVAAQPRARLSISTTSSANAGARPLETQHNVMQFGDSSRFGPPTPPPNRDDPAKCFWCDEAHQLRDCPTLVPLADLADFESAISKLDDGDEKTQGLKAIAQLRIAHNQLDFSNRAKNHKAKKRAAAEAKAVRKTAASGSGLTVNGVVRPTTVPAAGATTNGSSCVAPHANGHGASNGHRAEEAIVIDDDDETENERPLKRQRKDHEELRASVAKVVNNVPAPAPAVMNDHGPQSNFQGCPICLTDVHHVVRACPIVKAGPESIAEALKRFQPDDYLYGILSMMHRALMTGLAPSKLPRCPFCNGSCGQTVRECAETRGSRKQLKHKIRHLEVPLRDAEDRAKQLKAKRDELFQAGIRSDADHANIENVVRELNWLESDLEVNLRPALAPLYEAYLSWPNPHPVNQ